MGLKSGGKATNPEAAPAAWINGSPQPPYGLGGLSITTTAPAHNWEPNTFNKKTSVQHCRPSIRPMSSSKLFGGANRADDTFAPGKTV